jgi:endonuclease YncB( thermonuclease family)
MALIATEPTPALADIIGRASVIDGDTIEIHGERIRLHGIDAPESGQNCVWVTRSGCAARRQPMPWTTSSAAHP